MISPFLGFLNGLPPSSLAELPVNHIAHVDYLNDFLTHDAIKNDYLGKCEIFDQYFLYIFYGKPEFRLCDKSAFPICLVLKMPLAPPIKAFPFDSGAFHYKKMEDYFKNKYPLEDFEISPLNGQNHKKVISCFFNDNNTDYYTSLSTRPAFSPSCPECIKEYSEMIADKVGFAAKLDNRKSAIELIYDTPLSLLNNQLELIVLPDIEFNINGGIEDYNDLRDNLITKYNCVVESYDTSPGNTIDDFYKTIHLLVKKHLKVNSYGVN